MTGHLQLLDTDLLTHFVIFCNINEMYPVSELYVKMKKKHLEIVTVALSHHTSLASFLESHES